MENNRCFVPDCVLNVEYECQCSPPPVYICKMHVLNHMETLNKDHALKSIFVEPCEKTRNAKYDSSIIEDFNKKFKEAEKIQRNFKNIIVEEDLEEKSEILESSKNSELDKELKDHCLAFDNDSKISETSVTQAYKENASNYQQKPSIFNLVQKDNRTNLLIFNNEIESQASIILDTPQPLSKTACIVQLPNGKLFCFGDYPYSGITLLIDEKYRVEELPSGTVCNCSSVIYFNNNIYCFGGVNNGWLTLSSRFDLDRNQWNDLIPLPNADGYCNSVIFNGTILIAGYNNKNLWRYSIDSNSFSTIPYEFAVRKIKILINAERLYLIECYELIYESEIGSDTTWRHIKNSSRIDFDSYQTNCQYNKEEIYIGCIDYRGEFFCFKFNLNEKRLIKLI